jgi:hypothetical protein
VGQPDELASPQSGPRATPRWQPLFFFILNGEARRQPSLGKTTVHASSPNIAAVFTYAPTLMALPGWNWTGSRAGYHRRRARRARRARDSGKWLDCKQPVRSRTATT